MASDGLTCGVTMDGALWCWGDDRYGQLGEGGSGDRSMPQRVGADSDWERVHAGSQHACAVKSDPSLWCWGNPAGGRLGLGTGPANEPRRVGTDTGWTDVRAGLESTCGLRDSGGGGVWCFGANLAGEAGDDTPAGTPVAAPSRACL